MSRTTVLSSCICPRVLNRVFGNAPASLSTGLLQFLLRPSSSSHSPSPITKAISIDTRRQASANGGEDSKATKAAEDTGFSEELRRKLEERVAAASYRTAFARELATAQLPTSAGAGTRHMAGTQPWYGSESVEDASLRMLDDAVAGKLSSSSSLLPTSSAAVPLPSRVDTGSNAASGRGENRGLRLADARERTSLYSMQKQEGGEREHDKQRREMTERSQQAAAARGESMMMSVRALESLANQRIEDAIARGQFRNLPRGRRLQHDYNASNPFLDTTEYFMNKIIQKQNIVPEWIEKQQELTAAASRFRYRLRADWKRHAARMISSQGGSLAAQVARARAYADAEKLFNPKRTKKGTPAAADAHGHFSQITLSAQLAAVVGSTDTFTTSTMETVAKASAPHAQCPPQDDLLAGEPSTRPFRDPAWVAAERSFLELSVSSLNTLTRSYNLMAPELARKPYFALDRELAAAYADVAPQLPGEISDRALDPNVKVSGPSVVSEKVGDVQGRFGTKQEVKVWDEQGRRYGFREFWRDLFARKR